MSHDKHSDTSVHLNSISITSELKIIFVHPFCHIAPRVMRFSSLISPASLLVLAAFVVAEDASDVLSLTAATFASSVDPEPLILVEFFAPW